MKATGLRIGVVGIPGKWSTELLADAFRERTGTGLVVDMAEVHADLAAGRLVAKGVDLCHLDGIVVKKISQEYSPGALDRIELLRLAEGAGVRVFSRPQVMIRMIDRLACTMTLRAGGIPMPPTVVTEDSRAALQAVEDFGSAVFKPLFSTKAKGMQIITSGPDRGAVTREIDRFREGNPMMYIQQKINLPGRDFGMVFLGGEYLGSYARVVGGDAWNTTVASGGKYSRHDPPQSTIDLAARAERLFGMDFTTVDVADTDEGPVVFEVSAFGGFRGAKEGIGIDAAGMYSDYVIRALTK